MRLSNSTDRAHVTGAVTDNLEGLLAGLPSLRTGEAIIVGEAVHLPMRALIDPPPSKRRPESDDPKVYTSDDQPGGWNSRLTPENYEEVVALWRKQDHRYDVNKGSKKKGK
jgi:DNA helicase HerA-like ATPase